VVRGLRLRREIISISRRVRLLAFNRVVTLLEDNVITIVQDGVETEVVSPKVYRCEGRLPLNDQKCMLVWDRFGKQEDLSGAVSCALRGHRNQYKQFFGGPDSETFYVRRALRRDGPRPQTQVQAPESISEPQVSVADLLKVIEGLKAQVAELSKPKARARKAPKVQDLPEDLEPAF
jgi:hypothetical protein